MTFPAHILLFFLKLSFNSSCQVLPKKADWIKQRVVTFDPHKNKVITQDGQEISYEFLVVALGIQLNYDQVGWCFALLRYISSAFISL